MASSQMWECSKGSWECSEGMEAFFSPFCKKSLPKGNLPTLETSQGYSLLKEITVSGHSLQAFVFMNTEVLLYCGLTLVASCSYHLTCFSFFPFCFFFWGGGARGVALVADIPHPPNYLVFWASPPLSTEPGVAPGNTECGPNPSHSAIPDHPICFHNFTIVNIWPSFLKPICF